MIEFIVGLFVFIFGRDEDDSLDLTDTPTTAEYAKAQAKETKNWETRMQKKGRRV